jgi:murein DD-endopeptidase MepM/ murein hydrolase activator NlpD
VISRSHIAHKLKQLQLRRSPKLVAGVVVALGGFAAVAFAVAPMAADGARPAQQVLVKLAADPKLAMQLHQLAGQELQLWRSGTTRDGDSLATLLRRLGVHDLAAEQTLAQQAVVAAALEATPVGLAQVRTTADGRLLGLVLRYPLQGDAKGRSHFSRLTSTLTDSPDGSTWHSQVEVVALQRVNRMAAGSIRSSLKAAAAESHLPASVVAQLGELYSGGAEVPREMRKGEAFTVVYEALLADGEPVPWNDGAGKVLAAQFSPVRGPARQVLWFKGANDANGAAGYYDAKGKPLRQAFLAAPLEGSTVTSGFELRMDPILRRTFKHQGVDYAAPMGTPVRGVASGVVVFAGQQTGYGNVVEIQHGSERSTLYAHLNQIDVAVGDTVAKGDVIGAVGRTGWATGPHLHFEYRINGEYQDPELSTRTLEQAVLGPAARRQFEQVARSAKAELAVAQSLVGRRSSFE